MRSLDNFSKGRTVRLHPYSWIWEPVEEDPGVALRSMFGGQALYFDGKMCLLFMAKDAPWNGVLVCTDKERQPELMEKFHSLSPHSVLKKWLYLPEDSDQFEEDAVLLTKLARKRDPLIGVTPKPRKRSQIIKPNFPA